MSIYQSITIHFVVVYKRTLWRRSKNLKVMNCFDYSDYGMLVPQAISLVPFIYLNDLPIFFSNSMVDWKVDSEPLKKASSYFPISWFQSLFGDRLTKEVLKLYLIQGVDMSIMFDYAWGGAQRCR